MGLRIHTGDVSIGGPDVTITSTHWGPHHSAVAEVMGGVGLWEFSGSATIAGGPFRHGESDVGCPTCHMAPGYGAESGGHTLKMSYDLHGTETDNVAGCMSSGCHSAGSVTDFNKFGDQETVAGLLADLETALQAKGILDAEGGLVTGTYSGSLTSAFLNFQTITEDKSLGIHNPPYVIAVLENTIEAVNGM